MEWAGWLEQHRTLLAWMAVVSAVTLVASAIALPWIILRIPVDYFAAGKQHETPWADRHPVIRLVFLSGKNLVGGVLVLAGIAMLVLPGQGILTILAGLALVDFPGRHRLLRRFVCQAPVLRSINWIRDRARRPRLVVDCATVAAVETRIPPIRGAGSKAAEGPSRVDPRSSS